MELRQLTTIEDYRAVCGLEQVIWGYTSAEDAVPVPMMIVTQKVGGLLLGAVDQNGRLVGFAYSLPGIRDGRPFQWSHMLGVVEGHRDKGVGWLLKLEQRRMTIERGMDLIEWTFDPLQALNAHFNFAKLGAIAREYHLDVYGESSSTLHRGTATDRLIAEWWLRSERVEQRLAARVELKGAGQGSSLARSADLERSTPLVNEVEPFGEWIAPVRADVSLDADRLAVTIPTGFTDIQRRDLGLARAWRASTREIFGAYLSRGYEVTDFVLERPVRGTYILARR